MSRYNWDLNPTDEDTVLFSMLVGAAWLLVATFFASFFAGPEPTVTDHITWLVIGLFAGPVALVVWVVGMTVLGYVGLHILRFFRAFR